MCKSLLYYIDYCFGKIKKKSKPLFLSILLFSFISPSPVFAESIIEISPLDFGTIAIKDNSAAYTLRVRYTGQIINDPEIIIIAPGSPAEYFISDLPVSTLLTISITSPSGITTSPAVAPTNEQFTISNFDYLPSVTSDATGEYTLFVGATITTSGVGTYQDTFYVTTMTLNISY